VIPEDDPTFPKCDAPNHADSIWCDHVRTLLTEGGDAHTITLGMRFCVPLVPTYALWAAVAIDTDTIGPNLQMAYMFLVKPDPFGLDEELINIGLWSQGEGRASMSAVIADWLAGTIPLNQPCKNSLHGPREENQLERMKNERGNQFKTGQRWCLAMMDMCWACAERLASPSSDVTFPANTGNFGVNTVEVTPPRDDRQNSVFEAVRRHTSQLPPPVRYVRATDEEVF
jgi:hypothetical protein